MPAPTVRTVAAPIEGCDEFGTRLRAESDRPGVTTSPAAAVLTDGAERICNLAAGPWPQAAGVLDVSHALEHISDAVKGVFGEATGTRTEGGREALLAGGKAGLQQWPAGALAAVPEGSCADPLIDLAGYAAKRPARLNYAERPAGGRGIGSEAVEGAIRREVNPRLKRTGARWRAEHVGPLVELRAPSRTPDWQTLWTAL